MSFIVGSEHRRISLPGSSHCFLCRIATVIPTSIVISVINKDLCGGVGGIRDTRVKGNWHSTFPRPLMPAQQKQQCQIKEGNAGHTVSWSMRSWEWAERNLQPREAAASRCKKQFYKNSPLLKYGEGKPSTWVTYGLCQIIYILYIVSTGYMVAIKIIIINLNEFHMELFICERIWREAWQIRGLWEWSNII